MVKWGQYGLPDPGTVLVQNLVWLHDAALAVVVIVVWVVSAALFTVVSNVHSCRTVYSAHRLEIIWTAVPGIILLCLAVPSIRLLYKIDEIVDPQVTVKAIGHQWYWSYEYGDFGNFEFDSYIRKVAVDREPVLRLLEVDKRCILPVATRIRMIVSAADVIHSWAIPELGVKMDGIPGRLNQVAIKIVRPGVYRGMCSELCGVNHAYMPIVVEAIPMNDFIRWAKEGERLAKV